VPTASSRLDALVDPIAMARGHSASRDGGFLWPKPSPTYAPAVAPSPQTLSVDHRRVVASWAADCAEHVLVIYEDAVPGDSRVRAAIDQARAFASGDLDVGDAVRRRGGEAGAAAREAPTPAA